MTFFDKENTFLLEILEKRFACLNNQRKKGYHTDTLLSVDSNNGNIDQSLGIEAHSFVLSAISDYFLGHFRHTPPLAQSLNKPQHRFYVHLPGFSAAALHSFIEFVYTGCLNLVSIDAIVKIDDIKTDELATSVVLGADGLLALSAYLVCEEALCVCRNWIYEQLLMRLSVEDVAPGLVESVLRTANLQADSFLFDIGLDVACAVPHRFIDALAALPEDVFYEVCLSGRPLFSLVVNDAKGTAIVAKQDTGVICSSNVAPASTQIGKQQSHRRLLFGSRYLTELLALFDAYHVARKRQDSAQSALVNATEHSQAQRTQLETMFASGHPVSKFYCGFKGVPIVAYPSIYVIDTEEADAKHLCTFDGFPPWDFAISSIRVIYIKPSSETQNFVAGIDIEYRNIWTGEKSWFLCGYDQITNKGLITNKTVILAEGEFITKVHCMNSNFCDKLSFTTTQSSHADSVNQRGMTIAPDSFDASPWPTFSELLKQADDIEMAKMSSNEDQFHSIEDGCYLPLGLHGFRYEQCHNEEFGVDGASIKFYAFKCLPAHTLLTTTTTPSAVPVATTAASTDDTTKSKLISGVVEFMPLVDVNRFTNITFAA